MKKKNLKWYETPQMDIVEMETAVSLLAGSDGKPPVVTDPDAEYGS